MTNLRRLTASLAVLAGVSTTGCSADDGDRVVVFAAASLSDAFAAVETAFEEENPDLDVDVNTAGSSTLRLQIEQGAPADVVAVANTQVMETLRATGLVVAPQTFATNAVVLAVPVDNPGSVESIADLGDASLLVGVCAPQVPCGSAAARVFEVAGIDAAADTEEPDVRALATKLAAGELDAGMVYATDVASRPATLREIPLPVEAQLEVSYPIAEVSDAGHPEGAARFVEFVLSEAGQEILAEAGFGTP